MEQSSNSNTQNDAELIKKISVRSAEDLVGAEKKLGLHDDSLYYIMVIIVD